MLFLTDILPTAWQAVNNAQVKRGSTVAIYGAGPVGLLSAACAKMLGAEKIFMVDHNEYRLNYAAATYDAIRLILMKSMQPNLLFKILTIIAVSML